MSKLIEQNNKEAEEIEFLEQERYYKSAKFTGFPEIYRPMTRAEKDEKGLRGNIDKMVCGATFTFVGTVRQLEVSMNEF